MIIRMGDRGGSQERQGTASASRSFCNLIPGYGGMEAWT